MPFYTVAVTGAVYVADNLEIEAKDNVDAVTKAEAIVKDKLSWDELHSRSIIAIENIGIDPQDAEDLLGDETDQPAPVDIEEVDFFLDEDGEQVVVEAEDYDPSENESGVPQAEREDISDEIEGGVSVEAYEQDGEGM